MKIFYNLALFFVALIALPKLLYQYFIRKKYRTSLSKRLGKEFPLIEKRDRYLVWLHAVSVGETRAIAPLAKVLKNELDNPLILISSVTETGHAEAQRAIPFADYHVYLPFDFSWMIEPIVKRTSPDLVVLCESDFWFNFLHTAKKKGAKIFLANGKLSEHSTHRFAWFRPFTKRLFGLLNRLCVQNQVYAKRFEHLGVPTKKISVTGNMKFDDNPSKLSVEELAAWKQHLGIKPGDFVLVIGSSHDPEEKLLLQQLEPLWKSGTPLKVLLVPRHPERFNAVAELLDAHQLTYQRFSKIQEGFSDYQVLLIDAMGVLRKCYQVADVAIVAGSFTHKVGGHNILEPLWYGVPVLYGPHMHAQPELEALMREYNILSELIQHPERRSEMGLLGKRLVEAMHGATYKTWLEIRSML